MDLDQELDDLGTLLRFMADRRAAMNIGTVLTVYDDHETASRSGPNTLAGTLLCWPRCYHVIENGRT